MWLSYLGVTIIAPYLLSSETPYSRSVRNLFIIFGPSEMKMKYKEHQHTANWWGSNSIPKTCSLVSYQLGHTECITLYLLLSILVSNLFTHSFTLTYEDLNNDIAQTHYSTFSDFKGLFGSVFWTTVFSV